ncbi:MAG: leucyl aminopeptidase family protein [Gammaproteobacteria bacterium]
MPPARSFRISQSSERISNALVGKLDHLIVIVPHRIPTSVWTAVPGLKQLQSVFKRRATDDKERPLHGTLTGGTGVTIGVLPKPEKGSTTMLPTAFNLLRLAGEVAADSLADQPRSIGILVSGFTTQDRERVMTALLLALGARAWNLPSFRRKPVPPALKVVQLLGLKKHLDLNRTMAEIDAANLVRWLTALPANKLSTTAYRDILASLAATCGWSFDWLGEDKLRKLNAGAFLAVAQGNGTSDAGIAHLRYRPRNTSSRNKKTKGTAPATRRPDVALVGKGIIFDTGGTNLKAAPHMLDMHTDMSGSAVALAVLLALTELKSPLKVDCWLAITENRTGPAAYKQRDVITASNGVTIEVMHTDAEGRMVLADTLALAGREKPQLMLDYATLTGACVYALSERFSGVFTNREAFNELLIRTGRLVGERVWPFPNDADFDDDLKSKAADVAQCASSGEADQILATRFLQRFVPDTAPWIHMDLAAAWRKDGLAQVPGGATGFGVRYTLALLLDHAAELKELAG